MTQNRLAAEKSPYLLQHATNPVDWFPWGEEAFARAAELDRPIFLSIGYATCHWCHVMEKESFEDTEVAEVFNDRFVSIKVDREERPDVDAVYMTVCQMLTGSGGWPLTLFLTPDRKPFFAATYLPKAGGFGRPGLIDIGKKVDELWRLDRARLLKSAGGISGHLGGAFRYAASPIPGQEIFDSAFKQLESSFDPAHGGFGGAPKFPTPHRLSFLLLHGHRTGNGRAVEMAEQTLAAMRRGGIWDHVGFGFHRYATDARWFLPHFEKMLYDQALLAGVCLEAGQRAGRRQFHQTAEEIFTYVLRDMTDPEGGFYAAEDADSEGEEGRFYVWTASEFRAAAADADLARRWEQILGVQKDGNFAEEASGKPNGANILTLTRPISDWAAALDRSEPALAEEWRRLRQRLLEIRSTRVRPLCDEKILTDWNGLMISALADGSRILGVSAYGRAARKAARFILDRMRTEDGRLFHRYREKESGIAAMADDYAFFIRGLLSLYRVFFDPADLEAAAALQGQMVQDFWDETEGGFFLTTAGETQLPVRPKQFQDGALPSGNSVALENLVLLSRFTGDHRWEARAERLAASVAGTVERQPTAFARLLGGLDALVHPGWAIVIAGEPDRSDTRAMIEAVDARYLPASALVLKSKDSAEALGRLAPYTRRMGPIDGQAAAYLCKGRSCDRPTTDPDKVFAELHRTDSSSAADRP